MGGLDLHEMQQRAKFCDVRFVDCLVSFKQGEFRGILSNISSEFDVFAVLAFDDLLNVIVNILDVFAPCVLQISVKSKRD